MNSSRTAAHTALAALLLPLAACSATDGGDEVGQSVTNERLDPEAVEPLPSEDAQPLPESTDALEIAAQEYADRFGAAEYDLAWSAWTEGAQDRVDQDTFVAWSEQCGTSGEGRVPEVSDVRILEPGEGTVRVALGGDEGTYTLLFEDEEWRWVPSDDTLQGLADATPADLPPCP